MPDQIVDLASIDKSLANKPRLPKDINTLGTFYNIWLILTPITLVLFFGTIIVVGILQNQSVVSGPTRLITGATAYVLWFVFNPFLIPFALLNRATLSSYSKKSLGLAKKVNWGTVILSGLFTLYLVLTLVNIAANPAFCESRSENWDTSCEFTFFLTIGWGLIPLIAALVTLKFVSYHYKLISQSEQNLSSM